MEDLLYKILKFLEHTFEIILKNLNLLKCKVRFRLIEFINFFSKQKLYKIKIILLHGY